MNTKIVQWRKEIARIDRRVIAVVSRRLRVVEAIGRLKHKQGEPVRDIKRERELFALYKKWSRERGVDYKLIKNVFSIIIAFSKKAQERIKK